MTWVFFALLVPLGVGKWRLLLRWMYRPSSISSHTRGKLITLGFVCTRRGRHPRSLRLAWWHLDLQNDCCRSVSIHLFVHAFTNLSLLLREVIFFAPHA
jgi:hypothetical protein